MKKRILVSFAKQGVYHFRSERIEEFKKALHKANRNLYGRFGIWLSDPHICLSGYIIEMDYPPDVEIKNVGSRLKGIPMYLLKNYPLYKTYLVGTRLFNYMDITEEDDLK